MTIRRFHRSDRSERRGEDLPARLRFSARRGVTLVELMIAMLILALVCISWLEIIGIQSARKEARRREAVEQLAGMMDAFTYAKKTSMDIAPGQYYYKNETANVFEFVDGDANQVYPLFGGDESPIGYQLCIVDWSGLSGLGVSAGNTWGDLHGWLVGRLYERSGTRTEAGKPFFTVAVFTGVEF